MSFAIREATEADLELIEELIRALADYERLAHEVVMDAAALRRGLFGERRYAEVLIGEEDGRAAGFALFFHNFSTFLGRPGIYLEDLFVRPEERGKGYGRALLQRLAEIAVERGCGRLEWAVLDWNQPAIGFYRRLGARPNDDWTVYRLAGDELNQLAGRP
ncbi:MAG TPA: GNAT family N-acetyltransferase [Candidatus Dormibacteraeota bacterium]|nr:GNAT family N-acetyltransferase [Candidatus Dormibacteraeota bacterium]